MFVVTAWRDCATNVAAYASGEPMFWLEDPPSENAANPDTDSKSAGPNSTLLLFSTRTMPTITAGQIDQILKQHTRFYVLTREAPSPGSGTCTKVRTFNRVQLGLWRIDSKAQATSLPLPQTPTPSPISDGM